MSSDTAEPTEKEPATNYHETVDDLRKALMSAHFAWHAKAYHLLGKEKPTEEEKLACAGGLMASCYAYTLAAILGIAQREGPPDLAAQLAFEADEIMTNGDFDDLNADLGMAPREPDDC